MKKTKVVKGLVSTLLISTILAGGAVQSFAVEPTNIAVQASEETASVEITRTGDTVSGKINGLVSSELFKDHVMTVQVNGKNTAIISAGSISADGTFTDISIYMSGASRLKNGDLVQVSLKATTSAAQSYTSNVIEVTDMTEPVVEDKIILDDSVDMGSQTISGKLTSREAIAKNHALKIYVNGVFTNVINDSLIAEDGSFKDIPLVGSGFSGKVKVGDTVEITAMPIYVPGTTYKSNSVTIKQDPEIYLTAEDYTLGNNTLSGTFGKRISKVRLWVNGVAVKQAETDGQGNFTLRGLSYLDLKETDTLEIVGVDSQYIELIRMPVTLAQVTN